MAGILQGITVVDLSRLIAGPYAAMVLADLGARVIKVEALSGEEGGISARRSTAIQALRS
ncbi:CoA transferase [Ottowia sp. VDI28]|uniref:CoA transferase n=1 Tax=Ottowia sp. VDI28 TaxID=3133968 RepID=UPI003C2EBCFC